MRGYQEGPPLPGSTPSSRARSALVLLAVVLVCLPAHAGPVRFSAATVAAFTQRWGEAARQRLLAWETLMIDHAADDGASKREHANDFFNRVPWVSDLENWGVADYWATPMEMLGKNAGDCEDYAIAKYFTLTEMDVPRAKLLITYVRATTLKIPHMVLAYYPTPDADPYILDILDKTIVRASQRPDLIPVYSFNADGLWQAVQRGLGRPAGKPTRITMWNEMMARMRAEGELSANKGF